MKKKLVVLLWQSLRLYLEQPMWPQQDGAEV